MNNNGIISLPLSPGHDRNQKIASVSTDLSCDVDHNELTDECKIARIKEHFQQIMAILGLDLQHDSLKGTPARIANMYVKEIFKGLDAAHAPSISIFENKYGYKQMLVEKDIALRSTCEHHFMPITGRAHIAYFPKGQVIGLSKLNRIVDYVASRPQLQERLTVQIAQYLKQALDTEDVAVILNATHHCVSARGIKDCHSATVTSDFSGKFLNLQTRQELFQYIGH